jgi:benzoyl-CoA reductase/2-hydroxyglutaryl-CoA dehydratase subunit BcrC/BadD/HgdB
MVLAVSQTIQEVHNDLALSLEIAKDEGKKVVGCLCSYSPVELILAAGAIPVGLCGSTQGPIPKAEERLSPDQCPKVKATYGRAISGTCPLFPLADCVIAETTCDGRKKMYELLEREVPLHVMDLPQKPETPAALEHWIEEVRNTKVFLEQQLNVVITDNDLRQAIVKGDQRRKLITELYYCRKHHPGPINGHEFITTMSKLQYFSDFDQHIKTLELFLAELQDLIRKKSFAHSVDQPRILWTGLGNSLGCSKVLELVEEAGGVVVCQEGCGGLTRSEDAIGVSESEDPIVRIAKRYLRVTCACMTPNTQRFEDLERLIDEFRIDGVIDLAWQFCQPFEIESYRVKELVKEQIGLPFLHVVTDYSESDTEQLRIRIEGFMEQIANRKNNADRRL